MTSNQVELENRLDDSLTTPSNTEEHLLWTNRAILVSKISIAFTVITGIIGVILSFVYSSAALLAYSLESLVDVISSVLILWRFSPGKNSQRSNSSRDDIARIGIAIMFIILSIIIGIQASIHLSHEKEPSTDAGLLVISLLSIPVMFMLGYFKILISKKVKSVALQKDGVCSYSVAILSTGVALSSLIYRSNSKIWWIDAFFAIVIAIGLLILGSKTCINHYKKHGFRINLKS